MALYSYHLSSIIILNDRCHRSKNTIHPMLQNWTKDEQQQKNKPDQKHELLNNTQLINISTYTSFWLSFIFVFLPLFWAIMRNRDSETVKEKKNELHWICRHLFLSQIVLSSSEMSNAMTVFLFLVIVVFSYVHFIVLLLAHFRSWFDCHNEISHFSFLLSSMVIYLRRKTIIPLMVILFKAHKRLQ